MSAFFVCWTATRRTAYPERQAAPVRGLHTFDFELGVSHQENDIVEEGRSSIFSWGKRGTGDVTNEDGRVPLWTSSKELIVLFAVSPSSRKSIPGVDRDDHTKTLENVHRMYVCTVIHPGRSKQHKNGEWNTVPTRGGCQHYSLFSAETSSVHTFVGMNGRLETIKTVLGAEHKTAATYILRQET